MTTSTERTHESQWGREPITVDALVPTVAIRYHLGRVHVATPLAEVLAEVRAEITKVSSKGPEQGLWTEQRIQQTVAFTEWQHLENRAEYEAVMGASL